MQFTRNANETAVGPVERFTGAVFMDTAAKQGTRVIIYDARLERVSLGTPA